MATCSSASRQDDPNRAGKIEPSNAHSGLPTVSARKISPKAILIINPLIVDQNVGQDGWILASFFFYKFVDLYMYFVSVHKHARKELGQYPAILTEQIWSITH